MTQEERREYLIGRLIEENKAFSSLCVPREEEAQRRLLRSLMNVRPPRETDGRFLGVQDEYLREELRRKGVTDADALTPDEDGFILWKGDITTLRCGGIVNAANAQMLGCFCPCHGCIDNAIHTYAGVQLRAECGRIMQAQGADEETGRAKITKAYNLPCRYVLHTVGPIVRGKPTGKQREQLKSCYMSCLTLADQYGLESLAFCCISTGEFHFPNAEAAQIAVASARAYKERTGSGIKVIFNVFKEIDYDIYRGLLG